MNKKAPPAPSNKGKPLLAFDSLPPKRMASAPPVKLKPTAPSAPKSSKKVK